MYTVRSAGQFDKSEKSCGHGINIIHSIHIFNVTEEVTCECEQHCRFYDQKKDFQERNKYFSIRLFFA